MNFESSPAYLGDNFEPLKPIAIQIAEMFGYDCEVVIHDFAHPLNSVVFVVNGHVTGRKLGQSFNDLVQILKSSQIKNDQVSNYYKTTKDGKILKSSTSLIKDKNGEIIGALCINFDLARMTHARDLLNELCKTVSLSASVDHDEEEKADANGNPDHGYDIHSENVNSIMSRIISKVVADMSVPIHLMSRKMKIEIVSFLYEKEVFSIKGAVEELAKQLGMSKYTIYSYIDEAKLKLNGGEH